MHIARLLFYLLFSALVACKHAGGEVSDTQEAIDRPNIILIVADDQGWGDLGIHGNSNLETPNIDLLAREGISFENFYVQPVCSPTRAELLTGRFFTTLGVYDTSAGGERMNAGVVTIGEVFRDAGYRTAAYGKWHNGTQPPYHPNSRGFDDFYGFASGHWGNYFSPMLEHNGEIVQGNGFLADDLTDHALDFIDLNREKPFLLYLPLNTPHSPMQVPDAYWMAYKDRQLAKTYPDREAEDEDFTRAALAMVANIDHNVGRILTRLKDRNLEENTIVVYLSDNGPNSWRYNGGMRGRKGSTDEGGVRSPLFIRWTGTLEPGRKVEAIASALDLFPTLAHLATIDQEVPDSLDGRNLAPLLLDDDPQWPERLIYNHWNGKTSVRSQEFRLDHEGGLYHIASDRSQSKDVKGQYPREAAALQAARDAWIGKTQPATADDRPFTLGHPDFSFTHFPSRDGEGHGSIQRSNRYPNDSFFTNWTSTRDSITWDVEVLQEGDYDVVLYATVKPPDVGATIQLSLGNGKLTAQLTDAHDPPLEGSEADRVPRMESYTKAFKAYPLGRIHLEAGRAAMTLKALKIPGKEVADVRLLVFRR